MVPTMRRVAFLVAPGEAPSRSAIVIPDLSTPVKKETLAAAVVKAGQVTGRRARKALP